MQHRHEVRKCVSVVHLPADQVEHLRGTFSVDVGLAGAGHGEESVPHTQTL